MSTLITSTAQIGTIKDAAGNATAMTIDSSGRVATKLEAYGHFDLNHNSFSSGVTMGPFTTTGTLVGITVGTGTGSVASSRFTLPSAGVYSIQAKMYPNGNANPSTAGFNITKNGSLISASYIDTAGYVGSNGDFITFNHYIGEFAASDYIELTQNGSLTAYSPDTGYNHLVIYKIGVL